MHDLGGFEDLEDALISNSRGRVRKANAKEIAGRFLNEYVDDRDWDQRRTLDASTTCACRSLRALTLLKP